MENFWIWDKKCKKHTSSGQYEHWTVLRVCVFFCGRFMNLVCCFKNHLSKLCSMCERACVCAYGYGMCTLESVGMRLYFHLPLIDLFVDSYIPASGLTVYVCVCVQIECLFEMHTCVCVRACVSMCSACVKMYIILVGLSMSCLFRMWFGYAISWNVWYICTCTYVYCARACVCLSVLGVIHVALNKLSFGCVVPCDSCQSSINEYRHVCILYIYIYRHVVGIKSNFAR